MQLFEFRLLSDHLSGMICSLGLPYIFFVFLLGLGFDGGVLILIAPVPGYCMLLLDTHYVRVICIGGFNEK